MEVNRKQTRAALAIRLLILGFYLVLALSFWSFTVDDSYISARYALNACQGRGLVFNSGEYVMGYTNLLLVLIEVAVCHVGGDVIVLAKLLGLLAGVLVLWFTADLGQLMSRDGSPAIGLLAAAMLAFYPFLPLSSVNGLETTLFTALALAGTLLFTNCWLARQWGWQRQAGLAALFALATMARPEGLGFVVVLGMLQLAATLKQREATTRTTTQAHSMSWSSLSWIAIFLVLLFPVLIALTMYYGSPVPNTFLAKTATSFLLLKLLVGVRYLADWLTLMGLFLLVPLAIWPFIARKAPRGGLIIAGVTIFYTIYVLYVGYDWIPGYRFLIPGMPYFLLLAGAGMVEIWRVLKGELAHLSPLGQRTFGLLTIVALLGVGVAANRDLHTLADERSTGYEQAHLAIGEWLRDETPTDTSVALMDVGIIGFVSDRYIIDIAGLVNKEVAMLMHNDRGELVSSPATASEIARTVLAQRPDYIVLAHSNDPQCEPFDSDWSHDAAISASPIFQNHYRYLYNRRHLEDYYLSVYERIH
jgi:hypothetical protein